MSESPSPPAAILLFTSVELYLSGFEHQLGRTSRDLAGLKAAGLLCNEVAEIAKQGYAHNFGIGEDEDLLSLASVPFGRLLQRCPQPGALVFHHSYAASAAAHPGPATDGFMPHAQYFPAALLRRFELDHVPYFGSFATGCTGLLSLILTAAGLCAFSQGAPVVCLTADVKPPGTTYDARREKILTSDCASGFLIGREPRGYRALGIGFYSTKRELVPLVEIVKRTVQMVRGLTEALAIDCTQRKFVLHYPNIFPSAWPMVTNYLRLTSEPQALDGLAERAHCLSSDPVITLAKWHLGQPGRLHVVVNFGSGLHLGVGIFSEELRHEPGA